MQNKYITAIFAKSIDGGTGTFVLNILRNKKRFESQGIILHACVLEKPAFRAVANTNIKYFWQKKYYPEKYSASIDNIVNFYREIIWIKNYIDEHKVECVFGVDLRCNLIVLILKILYRNDLRIIATNHIDLKKTIHDKSTPFLYFILNKIVSYFYNKADLIVGVSKGLSRNLKKDFKLKRVITIYNGIEVGGEKPKYLIDSKNPVIINISRLVEQKDHLTLIKAFRILLNNFPQAKLWMLSDGPNKKMLEKYIKESKLKNNIKIFGWVPEIHSYLKKADVFVLSSKREGFAYVLIEAMQHGLPIVSTDTPHGPGEVLAEGKYGLLVPVGDDRKMNNAIRKLLTDKRKYHMYSERSILRAKAFSLDSMISSYINAIKQIAKKVI